MTRRMIENDMEHPAKEIFRESMIPLWSLAQRIGVSYAYLSAILNRRITPSPEIDAKINEYAKIVKDNFGKDARDGK